jgi:uncharacterized protein YciU (UPF0263 family)
VTASPGELIREFTLQFEDRLPQDVMRDVLDWADHREWLLALEVFAEKCLESAVKLDEREGGRFSDLVALVGGQVGEFEFIRPSQS